MTQSNTLFRICPLTFVMLVCCGCPEGSAGRTDGAGSEALAEIPTLTRRYEPGAMAIGLSQDQQVLVTAALSGRIGFHDAKTLAHHKTLDLRPLVTTEIRCYPRLTVIGAHAYAYYHRVEGGRSFVFKIDIAGRKVATVWEVPRSVWQRDSYLNGTDGYQGIVPLGKGRALAALGLEASFAEPTESSDVHAGISPLFVDLETGTFTRERLVELDGMKSQHIYTAVEGRWLFGNAYYHINYNPPYGPLQPHHGFILDLETGALTRTKLYSLDNVSFDPISRRLFLCGLPSQGWTVVDPQSGEILHQHPSPVAAFNMQIAGVFGGRALVIQTGGKAPSPLTLADVETGEALARTWLDDEYPHAAVTTRDGKRVYVGGFDSISSLEIPSRD